MTNDFSSFGLPAKLMQSLSRMQFQQPTPVQAQAIPLLLAGRDLLASAQTGTGKTGAFGIPIVAKLMDSPVAAALVLTPTRELAAQVMAIMQQLIPVPEIKTALLIGGEAMPRQFRQLAKHPRLIVGTPGRINDHLQRRSLTLAQLRYLVLDETDRMLDMGFGVQIDRILTHAPTERQTMLFSATLPQGIVRLANNYLKDPVRVSVGSTVTAAPNIKQEELRMADSDKHGQLLQVMASLQGSVIIFVKTKYATERLAERLTKQQYRADAIHGDLRQSRRDRVIQGFRDKKFQVLVATDIAARGLDVPHIETVVNFDLPQCPEDFIHRIGRTARAGASGRAISFITPSEHDKWRAIQRLLNPQAPRDQGQSSAAARPGRSQRKPQRFGHKSSSKKPHRGRGERHHAGGKPFAA